MKQYKIDSITIDFWGKQKITASISNVKHSLDIKEISNIFDFLDVDGEISKVLKTGNQLKASELILKAFNEYMLEDALNGKEMKG